MNGESQRTKRQRLGEILSDHGVITQAQLKDGLKVQSQVGGRIGSVLVEQGYLLVADLLHYLGMQLQIPTANLFEMVIDPAVMRLLPFAKIREYLVLPLATTDKQVVVGMLNPGDFAVITDLEFIMGRRIKPMLIPAYQMSAAVKYIEDAGETLDEPLRGSALEAICRQPKLQVELTDARKLFLRLVEERGSDMLLTAGVPPCIKKDNEVLRLSSSFLTPGQVQTYARELMTAEQREEFERERELDFAYTFPEIGRFRINIYKQRNSVSIAIRPIVEIIPRIDELGLPQWIEDFALKTQGLILVTGPTGHGKTTTLAALVDIINTKRKCNIITIEDPIEYLHKHKSSNVNQREVGIDTDSFHAGLRHIFRQAPDVIVVGEMRDPDSFAIAVQAAETGHLVLSTLHSNTATSTIDRIIDIFPSQKQQQIRVQVAENFLLILNQRLVPLKDGSGRVLACEKLINTYRVRNLIREGKTHQIRSMMQQSTDDFTSIDQSLAKLCVEGKITPEAGIRFCENPSYFNEIVSRGIVR